MMSSHAVSVVVDTQKGVDLDVDPGEASLDMIGLESALASKFSATQIRHAKKAI